MSSKGSSVLSPPENCDKSSNISDCIMLVSDSTVKFGCMIFRCALRYFVLIFCLTAFSGSTFGQQDTLAKPPSVIVKNDGSKYLGVILKQDAREVLIETKNLGQIIIPKHEIREIRELQPDELDEEGNLRRSELFATRYFITTNGLPIEKGESYVQWNLYGPDFQFGIGKNFGVGIMTSWVGTPIIGTMKYSIPVTKKFNIGLGTLLGTGSWAAPEMGIALPFAAFTYGNRRINVNGSFGYGYLATKNEASGRMLTSLAGLVRLNEKISIVFDSFVILPGEDYYSTQELYDPVLNTFTYVQVAEKREMIALVIPGIRWQMEENKAFQFGFAGILAEGELLKAPVPMLQWYRKI